MKLFLFVGFFVFGLSLQGSTAFAAKINCDRFSQDAKRYNSEVSQKQKQLTGLEEQLQSGTKAINDYNKNCRAASAPNCNPVMYNMISGQMTNVAGQKQKIQGEILTAKERQGEALQNLKSCKAVKLQKTVL
ncbi:hypothetical protein [Bdellovibrio sp. HCB337]|uniref:hypothetical protein n=1 Tax=Bdellovibrio sp. HCB337 TaxID=3394358 RepID=UPI0039A691C3